MGVNQTKQKSTDKKGILSRLGDGVCRLFKYKWAQFMSFFRREKNPKMVVSLLMTDETENVDGSCDDGTVTHGGLLTCMKLSVKISSPDEQEWIKREFEVSFKSTHATRQRLLNELIQLHYRYGVELNQIYNKSDKAEIASSSISLLSRGLGIAGCGLAFATFGTGLILTLCGLGVGFVSGGIALHWNRKRQEEKQAQWKKIKESMDAFDEQNEKLLHIVSEAEYLGLFTSTFDSTLVKPIQISTTLLSFTKEIAKTAAKTGDKVLFYGGIVISVPLAIYDMYVIGKNSKKLLKGECCEQSQAHFELARTYEQFRDCDRPFQEIHL